MKLVDPTGIAVYADDLDITDDFRDGFVQSLRVDTPDKTHFAAESAERDGRRDDDVRRMASTPPASRARSIPRNRRCGR